jgi:hypothetical protein
MKPLAALNESRLYALLLLGKPSSKLFGRNRSNGEQNMAPGNAALLVRSQYIETELCGLFPFDGVSRAINVWRA